MIIKRPIFNQQLQCVAFEILSYQQLVQSPELVPIIQELVSHSDDQLPLFIPFTLKALLEQLSEPINNPIILKLYAEDIGSTLPISDIQDSSFSIALLINTPQQLSWLNFADYIGLTEHLMSQADVSKIVQYSKAKQRKVMAYGLGQPINFDKCKAMSMDYFCGDFLFKPIVDDSKDIAANKLNLLHLIQVLQQEDSDLGKISHIIQSDPLLSFQLLRVANSVAFSCGQTIESIDHAVARLGLVNLRKWVMFFSLKNISDKPQEILESGLIRAHMAEEIAKVSSGLVCQSAYTAGLLSILDCLLNKPMTELLDQITIADEIKTALIDQTGPLGNLISLVIAYEAGKWEEVAQQQINGLDLSKLYIDSLAFVSNSSKEMKE
ncbi:EAL and HDOD domain-containing protein [Legionella waltersii]|uniref:Signal transduction protein n=1 Tax=Legionella waltersii TaxID=66969 RepID=A0A0W1A2W9_9GAMM|nr:HDOD domain-containing protein [Legionella waltersii]KTD75668.1 signal transduction protein [Legionella waltersii]SNU99253.1 signal transduction protein [Legionella waltersii]